jgi:hypothetical protein
MQQYPVCACRNLASTEFSNIVLCDQRAFLSIVGVMSNDWQIT